MSDCMCQWCLTLCDPMDWPTRLLCPWDSPGKNTGVGCHALLQGIFPAQGSNPCLLWLLHCRKILYCWATREAQGTVQERKERLRTRKCLKLPPKFFHNCLPATVSFLEWKKHFFISFQDGSGLICSSLAQKMYKAEKQVKSTPSPTT